MKVYIVMTSHNPLKIFRSQREARNYIKIYNQAAEISAGVPSSQSDLRIVPSTIDPFYKKRHRAYRRL